MGPRDKDKCWGQGAVESPSHQKEWHTEELLDMAHTVVDCHGKDLEYGELLSRWPLG